MRLAPWLLSLLFLSGCPFCGRGGSDPVGVQVRDFTLVPVGVEDPSELETVVPTLERRFPGLGFTFAPAEPIPEGVYTEKKKISAELLMDGYQARGPAKVFLIDADLSTQVFGAVYSQVDLPRGNAVVALPRMRTHQGLPRTAALTTDETDRERARHRIENQTASTVGKLLGMFPCKKEHCLFRRADTITELDKVEGLCDRHQILLEEKLRTLPPR